VNLDQQIRDVRTADVTLAITRDGVPAANLEVEVMQRRHRFLWGSQAFDLISLANGEVDGEQRAADEEYRDRFLDLYNFVTLPFYWGGFERERGVPDTQRILTTARWFSERGCEVKGHPLCWHTLTADWLLVLPNTEIRAAQIARIQREVTGFAGVINMWDVLNEVVIMPTFDRYDNGITRIAGEMGRTGIVREMFAAARAANPQAMLLLNDFDMSPDYERVIEDCLDAGIEIDAIGLQSHMHQGYWGLEKTHDVLERFSRFGLPLHFTELSLVSGDLMPQEIVDLNDYQVEDWPSTPEGEERQAAEVVEMYSTLFAHPQVEAITNWGLRDGAWLNAPSGYLRHDLSPKPAYEALLGLVKGKWWLAPTTMHTDDEGNLTFRGFCGYYEISAGERRSGFTVGKQANNQIRVSL
jgi:GH35 family endo-1,4-beta-xylanase